MGKTLDMTLPENASIHIQQDVKDPGGDVLSRIPHPGRPPGELGDLAFK